MLGLALEHPEVHLSLGSDVGDVEDALVIKKWRFETSLSPRSAPAGLGKEHSSVLHHRLSLGAMADRQRGRMFEPT